MSFPASRAAPLGLFRGVAGTWNSYFNLRGVSAENESLRQQVAALEVRLQEQRAQAQRADRLQALLGFKESTALPTLAAEVIAGNSNPGLLTVTINRGTADGVQADMAVISPKGIIGRVVGPVASHAARVQLLIDRSAAAGAVTERARAGGVVAGVEGDPPLAMDLVSNLADVKPGDVVVASGADGMFPKGFVVGTVEKSERGPKPLPVDHGSPGGRFLVARRRAGRARACSRRRSGRPGTARGQEVRAIGVVIALAAALALQTTLAGLTIHGATAVNLVLIAVIYVALAFGPVAGLMAGTVGGLVQDALAGGIVGVGGFSKTLVGFLVGVLGAQFIVAQSLPRFVMFVAGTVVHELCYQALFALVETRAFRMPWSAAMIQALVNGVIGILAFQIVESGPGLLQRRRARGATLSRRQF